MSASTGLTPEQQERLARYRAGVMSAAEREAFEHEVDASEALAEALRMDAASGAPRAGAPRDPVVIDAGPAFETAREEREDRGTLIHAMIPVAAAIVIGAAVWWWTPSQNPQAPRASGGGDPALDAPAARPIAPVGDLTAPPARFVWTRDAGAARYRVELYDGTGVPLGVHVTADTSLALEALTTRAHDSAAWRVVPLEASGRERPATEMTAYRVGRR